MNWNMDYDLASLFVLAVLLGYNIVRKELPLRKNLIFNALLISIAATDLLDILSYLATNNMDVIPFPVVYASVLAIYAAMQIVPIILYFLVVALSGRLGSSTNGARLIGITIFGVIEGLILTNPVTNVIFSFSKDGGYVRHAGFYIVSFAGIIILIASCFYIYQYKHTTLIIQRASIYAFAIISSVASITQIFVLTRMPLLCSGYTLSALMIYIAVQNPDSFREQRTSLFSKDGFDELQKELYNEKITSSMLCFTFADYDVIKNTYGDEIMRPCLRAIAVFLKKEICTKGVLPFYIHNGRFLLVKNGFYDFAREKTLIDNRFLDSWEVSDISFQFSPAYVYISSDIKMNEMQEVHSLISRALSDALKNGAFSYVSIDEELMHETKHDLKIKKALEKALENDTLEVWFQPIWSPFVDRINAAEALVRIRDEEMGLIYPDEFIKTSEANGSIMTLGKQVYRKVCEFISCNDIKKYGIDYIDVNLSPIQCLNEHFADEFIEIRKSYGIDSKLINLEITESTASDSPVMIENMLKLSRDGFSFSLDDYGTGYSNLMTMLSLPLSIIKIDKSIVWSYFDQSFAVSMVAGAERYASSPTTISPDNNILGDLIPMFQARGLKVICEGVETNEMVRVLEEMGCDYMQGFFFSKPIPSDDFLDYAKAKNRTKSTF